MDRNMGTMRPALNAIEEDAFGGLFQWGRLDDGHAYRASLPISMTSDNDVPRHDSLIRASD